MSIFNQFPVFLTVLGITLLIVEFAVLGFSTVFLVFVSFACFGTALLQVVGLVPETLLWSSSSVAAQTVAFGLLLWRPLRRLQNRQQSQYDQPSSFEGLRFRLPSELGPANPSSHQYSGIQWIVELDETGNETLAAGALVEVTRASVGKLYVRPANASTAD